MNNKSTIVRAILMDASECERPEAEHPATTEISAEDLQRILERHITAEPQATPFMWAIQEPGGSAYMDVGCVSSVREDVQAEVDGLNSGLDDDDDPYQVVPVYLAAAPQAVQAAVLAHLDDLLDDAAAHIYPSDLRKCQTSECTVKVASVRTGNREERSVPLFSREQVVEAFEAALAAQAKQGGA